MKPSIRLIGCLALCLACAPLQAQQKISLGALSAPAVSAAVTASDARARPMGHPRLFKGQDDYAGIVAATRAERAKGFAALVDYLKRHPVRAAPAALKAQIASTDKAERMAGWWQQVRTLEGAAEAAFAWHVRGDDWLLEEVKDRLALFGPQIVKRGCRGDMNEIREYAWYFALAYDFAYPGLSEDERALVGDVVRLCSNAGLQSALRTLRADADSANHFQALGKFIGALLIVRGDSPGGGDMSAVLSRALPGFVDALDPWGGDDGGYGNGSSYALWGTSELVLAWDLVERVLGVPIYSKPWLASFPRYLAYALPPGTPAGAFGDGAEVKRTEEWARLGKSIVNRSDAPLARWYARQLKGEDPSRLQVLLSPREYRGAVSAAGFDNGASFPSVGLAAMHSSLADPYRVTVLFKSSPFGSLNHSHADQNSFVIYSGGEVMAMDSGVYDSYNSAHWRGWYKETRAHNAITYDGGKGQQLGKLGLGSRQYNGRLVKFTSTQAYDIAVGDAKGAYGGDIDLARRALVFIRPSTVVTVDRLASGAPHAWEWNLHTVAPLSGASDGFKVKVGRETMCGTLRSSGELSLDSSQGYTPAPSTTAGPHYWHRFAFRKPSSDAVIVSVLRLDCGVDAPEISVRDNGATVRVAGRVVTVKGDAVTVTK